MLLHLFLLFAGILLVVAGAESVVRAAGSLAKRKRISDLVIGLTVVAFGTSLPELAVNVIASINNDEGIVVGNIVGSNLFNILAILGIGALIRPLRVARKTVVHESAFAVVATLMLFFAANDTLFRLQGGEITRSDGLMMLMVFLIFIYYTFVRSAEKVPVDLGFVPMSYRRIMIFLIAGFAMLYLGGNWVVAQAVYFVIRFGVTETLIGLTLISVGTSLPELATSIVASLHHRDNIAVGNLVGSNIFNSLFILPVSAIFRNIPFWAPVNLDLGILFVASLLILLLSVSRDGFGRKTGLVLIGSYLFYLSFVFHRG